MIRLALRDVFRKIASAFRTSEPQEFWVSSTSDGLEKAEGMEVPKNLQVQERGTGGIMGTPRRAYPLIQAFAQGDVDIKAIITRLVGLVASSQYVIQPNLEDQYAELDRWMQLEMSNLQPDGTEEAAEAEPEAEPEAAPEPEGKPPVMGKSVGEDEDEVENEGEPKVVSLGKRIEFETKALDDETVELCAPRIKRVYDQVASGALEFDVALKRLNVIYDQARCFMEQRALQHCVGVRRIFEHPNDRDEKDWPALVNRFLRDLFGYDFGAIGLGGWEKTEHEGAKDTEGDQEGDQEDDASEGLAEMYWVPGDEVRVLRTKETKKTPAEGQWNWVQMRDEKIVAHFTADQLLIVRRDPQKDGYGLSPIECIIGESMITAKIEKLNLDEIQSAYLSAGILNVGPGIQGGILKKVKADIERKVMGGKPRDLVVMAGVSGAETKYDRLSLREAHEGSFEQLENRAVSRKCRAFGVTPQDIGLISDYRQQGQAEVQLKITQVTALRTLLLLLEQTFNEHIVWRFWPFRDVMFHFPALDDADPRADWESDRGMIQEGVLSRADIAQKHNKPVTPGQRVRTIATAAGIMPVDKVEEVWQRGKVEGQFPEPPEGEQGAGGEQTPAPGVIPGMGEGVEYPELGNPFAEQKMLKQIDTTHGIVTRRVREIQKALDAGDVNKAKDKATLLASQADRAFDLLQPDEGGELPGQYAGEIMALLEEVRRAAHTVVEDGETL